MMDLGPKVDGGKVAVEKKKRKTQNLQGGRVQLWGWNFYGLEGQEEETEREMRTRVRFEEE